MCIISYMCMVYDVGYMCKKKDKKNERKRRKERDGMGYMICCVYDTWCDVCIMYGMRYVCERDGVGAYGVCK